ncbi:glycosyltransferase [Rubrivirga sp.]|uniref:glycosyltransferase n=1 Tax=Rubrivirga sp. TaxID=1885344 RepID=UPI003B5174A7
MLAVLVVAFVVQCAGWAWVGAGLRRVREAAPLDGPAGAPVPISVVVAAHDEAERLPGLLDALAAQTHRPFEVVVVDDRSTDATAQRVTWRAQDFPVPLRLVTVALGAPEAAGLPPKKHALERGAEAAAHARLAFTDADGRPGPDWLATLARAAVATTDDAGTTGDGRQTTEDLALMPQATSPLPPGEGQGEGPNLLPVPETVGFDPPPVDDGAVLVGYGPMEREDGWLNRFARYETVQTAALAAAGVGWGRPWHAVGRNLSYPAALLGRLGGFAHSAGSLSGDDDLLVQEVARTGAAPVRYVVDARGAVPSPAQPTARAFWRQKRRHASAGSHYPAGVLVALGLFHTSNLALWVGAPMLHAATGVPLGWGLLAGKLLLQRGVLGDALDGLGDEPDLRLWQPALDALSAGYHAVLAVLGVLPAPRRW